MWNPNSFLFIEPHLENHLLTGKAQSEYLYFLLVWSPGMCLTLFFNNLKSNRDRTKLLDGKESEFYKNCFDINYL